MLPLFALPALQFEVEVGLDVLAAAGQAGQLVGPQVQAGQQVLAEAASAHGMQQAAVGSDDVLPLSVAGELAKWIEIHVLGQFVAFQLRGRMLVAE